VVVALLGATACAPEAPAAATAELTDADRAGIAQTTNEFEEAIRASSFAAAAEIYTTDAIVLPPNAPTATGRAAIQSYFESFPPLTQFDLTDGTAEGSGALAFVPGTYAMSYSMPDGTTVSDTGKYIVIYRKETDGRWRVSHDIFNSDIPLPTAAAATP
jgi:ketosteroid isomerase-like protein